MANHSLTFNNLDLSTARLLYNPWYDAVSTCVVPHHNIGSNWVVGSNCDSNSFKYCSYYTKKNIVKPEIASDEIIICYDVAKKDAVVAHIDVSITRSDELSKEKRGLIVQLFEEKIAISRGIYSSQITNIKEHLVKKSSKKYGGGYVSHALRVRFDIAFV